MERRTRQNSFVLPRRYLGKEGVQSPQLQSTRRKLNQLLLPPWYTILDYQLYVITVIGKEHSCRNLLLRIRCPNFHVLSLALHCRALKRAQDILKGGYHSGCRGSMSPTKSRRTAHDAEKTLFLCLRLLQKLQAPGSDSRFSCSDSF